jgi:phosphoserine phosphatase
MYKGLQELGLKKLTHPKQKSILWGTLEYSIHVKAIYKNQEIEIIGNLIMDFDGTLIEGNSSLEEIRSIRLVRQWLRLTSNIMQRSKLSRPAIKSALAETTKEIYFSPEINTELLAIINKFAQIGGRAFVISAAHIDTLMKIQRFLNPNIHLIGSSSFMNLKGKAKAQTIQNLMYGEKFTYFGDSVSDFPIFKISSKAYLIRKRHYTVKIATKNGMKVEFLTKGNNA